MVAEPTTPALDALVAAGTAHRVVRTKRAGSAEEAALLQGIPAGALLRTIVVRRISPFCPSRRSPPAGADPARIAAQIVTGVGFLGAGAILKEGASIRGLTTAASLWTVAAVGMAAGAGAWGVAAATTILAIVSLWPLRIATERFVGREQHRVHLQLVTGPHGLGRVVSTITDAGGSVAHLASRHSPSGDLSVTVEVRAPDASVGAKITAAVGDLDDVDLIESKAIGD